MFRLSADPSWRVRHKICRALVTLAELHCDVVLPHMREIVQYMMSAMGDADETVAMEACEFWQAIAENEACTDVLRDALPHLVPLLLAKMVFSNSDLAALESEERAQADGKDIKPHFSSSGDGGDDGGGDDDDGGDYDEPSEWNIRKCASASLDQLSNGIGNEVLDVLLPYVQQQLALPAETSWPQQESAILALGAVSLGCRSGMERHLVTLVPYLLGTLNHPRSLVRSITCWTVSRYTGWIVSAGAEMMGAVLRGLLVRIHDPVRKVQEAACSALATIEEEAGRAMTPFINGVLETLMDAFVRYEQRNLLILYDAIGTLAEAVGSSLNCEETTRVLMPPLIARWNATADNDTRLVPLLECMGAVAIALGVGFQVYAQPIFERCMRLIRDGVAQEAALAAAPSSDPGDRDFLVCALDLVGGMTQGLGSAVDSLVAANGTVALLGHCCASASADVRQSAFALLGDLTKSCFEQVRPVLPAFLPLIVNNIAPQFPRVCCNAMWSLGEIAMRAPADVAPSLPAALQRIAPIVMRPKERGGLRNLMHNAAASLGRISIAAPDIVAPALGELVQPWCYILADLRDDDEKADGFRGLLEVLRHNPQGAFKGVFNILTAFASWQWKKSRPELYQSIYEVAHAIKTAMGAQWPTFYAQFSAELKKSLLEKYQLS
jgi:transportin-1